MEANKRFRAAKEEWVNRGSRMGGEWCTDRGIRSGRGVVGE